MEKQLILLDASALKQSYCKRKLYLTLIKGYRERLNKQATEFGTSFHLFASTYENTLGNFGIAVKRAVDYYRKVPFAPESEKKYLTEAALMRVCNDWFTEVKPADAFDTLCDENDKGEQGIQYPNGRPIVERKFAIDLYESDVVKILLCGTIDRLAIHRTSKLLGIFDYKTSSSWKPDDYLREYELNPQLYVYDLAVQHFINTSEEGSILHKYRGKDIAGFIDGVFVLSDKEEGCRVQFKRSKALFFKEHLRQEFKELLQIVCREIEAHVLLGGLPMREGLMNNSCGHFGGCAFGDFCRAEGDEVIQAHVIEKNFIVRNYNPMNHGGE